MGAKVTQAQKNPYPNSDTNKRYYTYDYFLKHTFGGKVAKLPLDAGFTCPNIDGTCAHGGCIYCSDKGSGDFAPQPQIPIGEQLELSRALIGKKWQTDKVIPYFQAHTNTYAPIEVLREKYEQALAYPGVVGLNIATRADCLAPDALAYLAEIAGRTYLTVELGLQSSNDQTAALINRGHDFAAFLKGFRALRAASPDIHICIHVILGLPGENERVILQTIRDVAALQPDQVKIHLLHVIKDTVMADMYLRGEYQPMAMPDYVRTVANALALLPPDTVVARLTGDGAPDALLAPDWSRKKTIVINEIDKYMYQNDLYQGKYYKTEEDHVFEG
ncbi:MAG: TIGR01212 family radical SAM protein [Clostridia bacterium]|nr:TIGR01212 family radical SAM protein [Clostridia bacterium]